MRIQLLREEIAGVVSWIPRQTGKEPSMVTPRAADTLPWEPAASMESVLPATLPGSESCPLSPDESHATQSLWMQLWDAELFLGNVLRNANWDQKLVASLCPCFQLSGLSA